MPDFFFSRAQARYDNAEPPEPESVGGFYAGDRVKIDDEFIANGRVNGYSPDKRGVVQWFEGDLIVVQCGRRLVYCVAEDLKKI